MRFEIHLFCLLQDSFPGVFTGDIRPYEKYLFLIGVRDLEKHVIAAKSIGHLVEYPVLDLSYCREKIMCEYILDTTHEITGKYGLYRHVAFLENTYQKVQFTLVKHSSFSPFLIFYHN